MSNKSTAPDSTKGEKMSKKKHSKIRKGGHIRAVRYHDLLRAKRARNPLSALTPARVRQLYELYREGKYADVQLAWDALEEYDDMLGTVLERRQSTLGEMEWDILIDSRAVGEDAAMQQLAEQQQSFIVQRLRQVENLMDAVKWLGLANFRRYAALEVCRQGDAEYWLPIHSWLLCRPALDGVWMYNENAETSCSRVEMLDMSGIILREVARPIDLVAMFLISAKESAVDGWDSFLEVYGNPAMFFKMPPGTSDEQRDEYAAIISQIVGEGRGVYPAGGDIQTIETNAANADAFSNRAEWCDKAIVRRATGGLLTVLAESGSGTLAGSAHMEAFRQLAANDAISIAECINRQYVRRLLSTHFPGAPRLVYFKLTPPVVDDKSATVNMICQLSAAGYRATDEVVSEEIGMEVHATADATTTSGVTGTEPGMIANTASGMTKNQIENRTSKIENELVLRNSEFVNQEEPPLTDRELAALRSLGSGIDPRQLAADADYAMEELRSTIDEVRSMNKGSQVENKDLLESLLIKNAGPGGEGCKAQSAETCRCHPGSWKPITLPDRMKPDEARERLTKGVKVTNPLGGQVTLDTRLTDHWKQECKTQEDVDNRLAALPLIEEVVKNPAEIWENDNGSHTYLASVIDPYRPKGKSYTVAFTQSKDNTVLETYYINDRITSNKRTGKQLWPKK